MERLQKKAALEASKRRLESPQQTGERLQKQAELEASKRRLESPQQTVERLQKQAELGASKRRLESFYPVRLRTRGRAFVWLAFMFVTLSSLSSGTKSF